MRIVVLGTAIQQGSKRAAPFTRADGRIGASIREDSKRTRPWRALVRDAAVQAMGEGFQTILGPVRVEVVYHLPRPQYHYRTGAHAHELRPTAPHWVSSKPDGDKLERTILDALTDAGVWRDDKQVAKWAGEKVYVSHETPVPQTVIEVIELPTHDGAGSR